MRSFILAAVLAIGLVMPASAARRGPDVAGIVAIVLVECGPREDSDLWQ